MAVKLTSAQLAGARAIIAAYRRAGLNPIAGLAVAKRESGLRPNAIGDGGHAFGLFQFNNAGGVITNHPNPRAYLNPNLNAKHAARAVAGLGARGKSVAEQVRIQTLQFERPADKQGAVSADLAAIPWATAVYRAVAGGAAPTGGGMAMAPTGGGSLPPAFTRMMRAHMAETRSGALPNQARFRRMLQMAKQFAPTAQAAPGGAQGQQSYGAGTLPNAKGGTYGFATGSVDSGKATPGGVGGDWGGSMPRALQLARSVGATPSSQKRSRQMTASGGISDHWQGSKTSYATDLPATGKAGDSLLSRLAQRLGVKLVAGKWNNITIGGYRYQIGWKTPGHYDHVHVGVKRA